MKIFTKTIIFTFLFSNFALANGNIKICLSDHIFKEFKSYGESLENAVKLAIEEEKAKVTYEKFYFDNVPLAVIENYQKMVKANCNAILGISYLSDLLAISNSNQLKNDIPIISPFGTTFSKKLHKSIHPIHPSQDVLMKKLVQFILQKYPQFKKATIVTDIRRSEMTEYKTALTNYLSGSNVNLTFIDLIKDEVDKIKIPDSAEGYHLYFIFTGTTLAAKFITQANYSGYFFGVESFGSKSSPSLINLLDKSKVKNIFAIRNIEFDNNDPARDEFYQKYKEKFNISPTMLSLYGFDATKILISMKSGKDHPYKGITGAQFVDGKVIKSNLYSITAPSEDYRIIEDGTL